jgi:hypothetical protein
MFLFPLLVKSQNQKKVVEMSNLKHAIMMAMVDHMFKDTNCDNGFCFEVGTKKISSVTTKSTKQWNKFL